MKCRLCEMPIEGQDEKGFHPFCHELAVSELAEDLSQMMRANPEKYEEIRPGVFIEKKKEGKT